MDSPWCNFSVVPHLPDDFATGPGAAQRWNSETSLFEVKILQRDRQHLLRSKDPDGITREIYGLLISHQYLQAQRARAASAGLDPTTGTALDPDRISFT